MFLQGMIEDGGLIEKRSIFQQLAFTPHPSLAASEEQLVSKSVSSNMNREERVNSEKGYR